MQIISLHVDSDILQSDDLAKIITDAANAACGGICDDDVLVISQKVISKQEGRVIKLGSVHPSALAKGIASQYKKDPRIVELILEESARIVRMCDGVIIVETHNGIVCANAGVDESNVKNGCAVLLPVDPDASARRLQDEISQMTSHHISVIISDTFGRPFRIGQTDCAIGVAGLVPTMNYAGKTDGVGKTLRVTEIAIADELASAAELVTGKTQFCPAAIVRGSDFAHDINVFMEKSHHNKVNSKDNTGAKLLQRHYSMDLFR